MTKYTAIPVSRELFEKLQDDREKAADRIRSLEAALRTEIAAMQEVDRGSTHWKGCEMSHPRCAAMARMNAALGSALETSAQREVAK